MKKIIITALLFIAIISTTAFAQTDMMLNLRNYSAMFLDARKRSIDGKYILAASIDGCIRSLT